MPEEVENVAGEVEQEDEVGSGRNRRKMLKKLIDEWMIDEADEEDGDADLDDPTASCPTAVKRPSLDFDKMRQVHNTLAFITAPSS